LDNYEKVKNKIDNTDMSSVLFPYELDEWLNFTNETRSEKIRRICTFPLCNEDFTVVYSLYFRLKWLEAFRNCIHRKGATVLEIGSGSSVNIPNALTIYDDTSKYVTANMNKKLTQGLKQSTKSLPIAIDVIEDDAINIQNYFASDSVDAIVFEHSVNDILQATLCEARGMDTTNGDWFEILPEMINIINAEYASYSLEQLVKNHFLSLVENCISVLKPNGYLIMSHYMFQYDLDLGYNPELWENILPLVRPWINELPTGKEVMMDTFDPQWWIFFQKHDKTNNRVSISPARAIL